MGPKHLSLGCLYIYRAISVHSVVSLGKDVWQYQKGVRDMSNKHNVCRSVASCHLLSLAHIILYHSKVQ